MNIKEAKEQLENTEGDCNCKDCEIAKEILNTSSNEEKR